MKKITCILFFVLLFAYTNAINPKILSKKIEYKELSLITNHNSPLLKCRKYFVKFYNKLRIEIDFIKIINPNLNHDTLFILQDIDDACISRDLSIAVWNKKKAFFFLKKDTTSPSNPLYNTIDYRRMQLYQADKKYNLFSDYMIYLVSTWDIQDIKREEDVNGIIGGHSIVAIRIIFKKRHYKIDCMEFKDFFNLKRDQTPFSYHPEFLKPILTGIKR